jgi:hypothetical protein
MIMNELHSAFKLQGNGTPIVMSLIFKPFHQQNSQTTALSPGSFFILPVIRFGFHLIMSVYVVNAAGPTFFRNI